VTVEPPANHNEQEDRPVPIDTPRVWLTEQTYDLARIELARLHMERATGSRREFTDQEQRERRIRQLQALVSGAAVGHQPADDGIAEPGMVLTVRYEADKLIDRFLMAEREESPDEDLAICSPHSPLGAALYGATAGERREVSLPVGGTMTVTLVSAVPYRSHDRPRTASRAFLR
jgi:transcription elongation factor GreA